MIVNSIEALALGFEDAGVNKVFGFPGFHAHDLFERLGGSVSVNEKIAYEMAWGSAIAGARTVVTFKNVGLHDAADPFINSYRLRTNAGLVLVVFDDVNLTGSQGVFDSRSFRIHTGGIWLEPKTIQECYDFAYKSFELSESSDMPVVIRMSNTNVSLSGKVEHEKKSVGQNQYIKDFDRSVTHPITGNVQFDDWVKKNQYLESELNETAVGIAPKNILSKHFDIINTIKDYAQEGHIVNDTFEQLYGLLRDEQYFVSMDLGGYTFDSAKTADVCLCFGASTAMAGGVKTASPEKKVCAIIGDTPFLHSGKNVIPELLSRNLPIDLFIMDNGGSQGTGGQRVPGDIEQIANVPNVSYIRVHLDKISEIESQIRGKSDKLRIFHIMY